MSLLPKHTMLSLSIAVGGNVSVHTYFHFAHESQRLLCHAEENQKMLINYKT